MTAEQQQVHSDLLTTIQVARALDVDRATLLRWVANGIAVPAMRLPTQTGACLFTPDEVERLRGLRGDRKQMPRDVEAIGAGDRGGVVMRLVAQSLAEAHIDRAKRVRRELAHAGRAPGFFRPVHVDDLAREYAIALRWATYFGRQAELDYLDGSA